MRRLFQATATPNRVAGRVVLPVAPPMILLSRVEDVFEIEGRGCVPVPGISESVLKDVVVHRGDAIELRKPDGSSVQTHVAVVEFLDRVDQTSCIAVVLPAAFSKRDIPVGTEIWLVGHEKHAD